jgi:hypothetical protein
VSPDTAPAPRRTRRSKAVATDASVGFRQRQLDTSRFGIVYDIDGPRIRLGVLWFFVAAVALVVGMVSTAVVFGLVAALAAAQSATALRARWRRPDRRVAAAIAFAMPLSALVGVGLLGITVMASALLAVVASAALRTKGTDPIVDAGAVIRSSLFVGLAAASMVLLHRVDVGAAVTLFLMVSAYEFGDFLVGSGASNRVEGPASGILAVVVATWALAVIDPPPFEGGTVWLFGIITAIVCPVGQVAASAILPRAGAPARALRRLDSYLVAAPLWLVLMWAEVHLGTQSARNRPAPWSSGAFRSGQRGNSRPNRPSTCGSGTSSP